MDLIERNANGSGRHPWEVARSRFFVHLLDRLAGAVATRVLDVGSGDAWLAGQLRAASPAFEITCWDVNYAPDELAELAEGNPGLLFSSKSPEGSFGGILMLDVIEHVEDDLDFVRTTIQEHLQEGGWLLASVPAYQSLFTSHDTWLKHYRRYSPTACRNLLNSAGLDVVAEGGLFHSLLPIRGLSAAKERLRRATVNDQGVGGWNGGPMATRATTAVLDADTSMSLWLGTRVHRVVPGLSYWAFCRQASGGSSS